MLSLLTGTIGILLTILIIVGFHEFGHFITARLVGVKVLTFSIGFGKVLYKKSSKKGTDYLISAIPLGGYVKMLDESEGNVAKEDLPYAYNRQPFYKKFLIVAAGPLFNLILAFFIYWMLFVVGFTTVIPVIGSVDKDSIAANAGLQANTEILKIDNHITANWTNVIIKILTRTGDQSTLHMQVRDLKTNKIEDKTLDLSHWKMDDLAPNPLESLGFKPYEPFIPPIIGKIVADSPAANSNLQVNDKILSVNGAPVKDWIELTTIIANHPHETLKFKIQREKKILEVPVLIGAKRDILFRAHGFLGMASGFEWPKDFLRNNKTGPLPALQRAYHDVIDFSSLNFIILGKMITGKISLKSLGGPITIFQSAGTALNHGLLTFASFLAFLSISIGIINIIPIPGLDGGHLLFQTIESITKRPMSERLQVLLYRFGFIFLMLMMVQALVNDMVRVGS